MSALSLSKAILARRRGERGFVAVTTALLFILLLIFAALAIDVAMYYERGAELQRAADASALAGVPRMPSYSNASSVAVTIAEQNQIAAGNVTVETVPGAPRRLLVRVQDPSVSSFFGRILNPGMAMTRTAVAEYVPRIEMGSRLNAIGTGDIPGWAPDGVGTQNFWLAINGACTPREHGDLFGSLYEGNVTGAGGVNCNPATNLTNLAFKNEFYPTGKALPSYSYIVDIPCPVAGQDPCTTPTSPTHVQVYHPYYDNTNTSIDGNIAPAADPGFHTSFTVRSYDGGTIHGGSTFSNYSGPANDQWFTLATVTTAGKYRVDVNTRNDPAHDNRSYGSNAFALRAYSDALGPVMCAGNPLCPSVAGEASIGVYANVAGGTADFYLAKLAPANYYRGKKVQVLLFDPGEGAKSIQILEPNGAGFAPTAFTYRTWTPDLAGFPTDSGFPSTAVNTAPYLLDVGHTAASLSPAQKAPWWSVFPPASNWMFNGRVLSIELQIPTDYGCQRDGLGNVIVPCVDVAPPQDGWWQIRYNTLTGKVTDRTTWTVRTIDDPVHLVHN